MSQESRERVSEIFDVAMDLAPPERAGYLDTACAGDPGLRAEIEALLSAADRATGWIHGLAGRLGLDALQDDPDTVLPEARIGPYRLVRLIGRGGMGSVYLAERADEHFEKLVALKLLPMGLRDAERRRRFLAERQILAGLSHPHIAALLDGGVTGDGTPYFVMEHVDGRPIDDFCDAQGLDLDARIDLFLQVCDAVAAAHRNLVVHRDLKPPNVLVDAEGRVKLLDFGIAKTLEDGDETQMGPRPMTPRYAAPELFAGGVVTTAADVYSLGVLLQELLVGVGPRGAEPVPRTGPGESTWDEEAPPPSHCATRPLEGDPADPEERARRRGTTPGGLRVRLQGDLDRIVQMALRPEPDRRYRSVDEFAADLRRYRADLPVRARPLTPGYRARKFVRRHRIPVLASTAAGLLAIAVAVLGIMHVVSTTRQARVIAAERDRAEQMRDFLVETFLNSDPNVNRGEEVTARELLDRGAAVVEEKLDGQPLSQALMMATMADVYVTLALNDRARPLLERARSLHEELGTTDGPDHAGVILQLALVEEQTGHYDAARALAEQAIELQRSLGDMEALAHACILLGRVYQRQGDLETASIHLTEAVRLQREHLGPETEAVALGLTNLASLYQQQGDLERAESMHREALRIRRALYGSDHLKLIESLYSLGVVTRRLGRLDEAQSRYEEALDITARLVPEGYADDAYMHNGLGFIHLDRGELDLAAGRFTRSIELSRRFHGDRHPNVGIVLASLGHVRVLQGRCDEARPRLEESLSILREAVPDHPKITAVEADLASCGAVPPAVR